MRQLAGIGLVILLVFSMCVTPQKQTESKKEKLFVSILPLKYFTDKIVGDHFDVDVMVPPGASPATYAPTPKQMHRLAETSAYFSVGYLGFEQAWLHKIQDANPAMEIISSSVGLQLLRDMDEVHGDHVHQGGIDPHVWVSPKQAKFIVMNIFEGVVSIDPGNRSDYAANTKKLLAAIDSVDREVSAILEPVKGSKFLIFHPSLGYLARDYHLEQLSIEYEGKSPSPRHMQHLIEEAEADNIGLVLIQKEFDEENATALAKAIDGNVVQIDPLDYQWPTQMISMAKKIADAL